MCCAYYDAGVVSHSFDRESGETLDSDDDICGNYHVRPVLESGVVAAPVLGVRYSGFRLSF